MSDKKLCPMCFNAPMDMENIYCIREKCAWWSKDDYYEGCAIGQIASLLDCIEDKIK